MKIALICLTRTTARRTLTHSFTESRSDPQLFTVRLSWTEQGGLLINCLVWLTLRSLWQFFVVVHISSSDEICPRVKTPDRTTNNQGTHRHRHRQRCRYHHIAALGSWWQWYISVKGLQFFCSVSNLETTVTDVPHHWSSVGEAIDRWCRKIHETNHLCRKYDMKNDVRDATLPCSFATVSMLFIRSWENNNNNSNSVAVTQTIRRTQMIYISSMNKKKKVKN